MTVTDPEARPDAVPDDDVHQNNAPTVTLAGDATPDAPPAAPPRRVVITDPGAYDHLDEETYHRDPVPTGSLSSSGARKLLAPYTPAHFHYQRTHPEPAGKARELGSAAHGRVLGIGAEIVEVPFPDWKKGDAQKAAKEARAAGKIPLLTKQVEQVDAMAAALQDHPMARALLEPRSGRPEVSLFALDEETEVMRRARVDFLPDPDEQGRVIIVDYKTTIKAHPMSVTKSVHDFGYYQQDAWYRDVVAALGLSPYADPVMVFIFQEKDPPYLVNCVQLEPDAVEWGRTRNRKAIDVFRQCTEDDYWPGYPPNITSVGLPGYADKQLNDAYDRGDFTTAADLDHHTRGAA